jgi:hypothetical protein
MPTRDGTSAWRAAGSRRFRESRVAELIAVGALLGSVALVALVPWVLLLEAGALLAAAGMAVGVPAGLLYHVRLRSELVRARALAPRWWWTPIRQHRHLDDEALRRVLPSCLVGAAGFAVAALGCALAFLGVVASFAFVGHA